MIITDYKHGWESKVNFTDSNDVFVGFDTYQNCCEDAGYFISHSSDEEYSYSGNDSVDCEIDGYEFDTAFFKEIESSHLDCGGQACFRLTKSNCADIYLHIYNSHNGYYGHGFEAKISGEEWQSGVL